jgi:hypothetical protein
MGQWSWEDQIVARDLVIAGSQLPFSPFYHCWFLLFVSRLEWEETRLRLYIFVSSAQLSVPLAELPLTKENLNLPHFPSLDHR